MRKLRREIIAKIVVILIIVAIVSHRLIKIVQKEERKQQEAESIIAKTIWEIKLPTKEFIGDLSQVGNYLVYELPENGMSSILKTYARRIDDGTVTAVDAQASDALLDPLFIGQSRLAKKEFRIEHDSDGYVVAQYHVATRARGIIAKLPKHCTDWKTVQRLPQNFFALVGVCIDADTKRTAKRIIVVELEIRRLPYASGNFPNTTRFVAFTN